MKEDVQQLLSTIPIEKTILVVNQHFKGMHISIMSKVFDMNYNTIRNIVTEYKKDPFYIRSSKINNNNNNNHEEEHII